MAEPASEQSIFLNALALPTAAQRAAYLDEVCRDNPVRAELEALLAAHERLGGVLPLTTGEEPAGGVAVESPPVPGGGAGVEVGDVLSGRYKLVQQIGEGGMGTVWMAQQQQPVKRLVALKVIKPGMDSRQVIARFEAERQALALMDHPNIARVLDAGTTATGLPFFVMELVKGVPLTKYCDEHRLTPKERLELFIPVCQAIQHAHQKGIIHRDIKPSNVLVALYDGQPVPKVIDFGIAKATGQQLTEHTLVTGFGAVVGTLEYMSPEQANFNQLDVDTRSDIYSLGVLLYELLAGSPPFSRKELEKAGMLEMLRVIREQEPSKPSTKLSTADGLPTLAANRGTEPKRLAALVRGELDWIVMKALEKDRDRRYETANGFAADIGRYLADEPVQACPPSATYRFGKFARRNRGRLAVAGLIAFFLAVLAGGAGWAMKDRTDRRAALEADVGRDLDEARAFCRADRLPEASAAVDQARALLARGEGSEDLAGRVSKVRADVDMAARLEGIRLEQAAVKDGNFDQAGADSRYRDAFRDYGLDVTALDADAAAERIRASVIEGQLLAALDDWLAVKGGPPDARLLAVLRRVDADPWRGRFRDAFERGDRKALTDLARGPAALAQPPATVVLLGAALAGIGERPLAVDVLRSAQQQQPNDFWINHQLALNLSVLKPSRPGEAVGYYRAALALRPDSPGAHLNLGIALSDQGDLADAVAEYKKAIALKPEYPQAHYNLGIALHDQRDLPGAVAELKKAIDLKRDFAQAHHNLGHALRGQRDMPGAVAEYKKAVDLKPDFAEAHCSLGLALRDQGDLPGAVAKFKKAIALKPDLAVAHNSLGAALHDQADLPGAVAEYQTAIDLKPEYPEAHYNLGNALRDQGDLPGAVAEYKKAIALKPDFAEAHFNLGFALRGQGDLAGAVAEYKKVIALKPEYPEAHCNLGLALQRQGEFQTALTELRRGHELGSKTPRWSYPSARWVRQCERLVQLDEQLPDFLEGKTTPAGPGERIELAGLCSLKRLNRATARFYEEAFAAEPKLADDLGAPNRYNAACAAALAGSGQGKDADKLDGTERARLRRQALDWLHADLDEWCRLLAKESDKARPVILKQMQLWLVDVDFAGVRGPQALARLPEAERRLWQKLWADVTDTLARARGPATPQKESATK